MAKAVEVRWMRAQREMRVVVMVLAVTVVAVVLVAAGVASAVAVAERDGRSRRPRQSRCHGGLPAWPWRQAWEGSGYQRGAIALKGATHVSR
eukprot:2278704-Prymnesium_polylepis.1